MHISKNKNKKRKKKSNNFSSERLPSALNVLFNWLNLTITFKKEINC